MSGIFPGVPKPLWIIVFLLINTAVNYVGISFTAVVNRLFLAAELIFVVVFVIMAVVAISHGVNGAHFTTTPLFNPELFTPQLAAGALSIAVLSFLGFDGIATLSEEAKGGRRAAGFAMITGLVLVAVFFVAQTWLAAMLVPGVTQFSEADENNAFFGIVGSIAGNGWMVAFLAMNALAVGIANAVAAQSATSRLLFSMSRDGRLPRFLAHIDPKSKAPRRAILVVGTLTLVLGLVFVGQIDIISTLVNFGALTAFLLLHVSVIGYYAVKRKSTNIFLHWITPVLGFLIIGFVLWNADASAKIGGLIWLVVGLGVLLYYRHKGTGVLEEHAADPFVEAEQEGNVWMEEEKA
jgi:amino acid transporter